MPKKEKRFEGEDLEALEDAAWKQPAPAPRVEPTLDTSVQAALENPDPTALYSIWKEGDRVVCRKFTRERFRDARAFVMNK